MSYVKQNLADGETLKAEHLEHIEEGLVAVSKGLTNFSITETNTEVTMVLTMEGGEQHTHVLNFDADGYPTSITVDGVAIPGTWEVAT